MVVLSPYASILSLTADSTRTKKVDRSSERAMVGTSVVANNNNDKTQDRFLSPSIEFAFFFLFGTEATVYKFTTKYHDKNQSVITPIALQSRIDRFTF